jgi:hypothetical protein
MYYFSGVILPFTAHPGDTITKPITSCLNPALYFPDEYLECDIPPNLVDGTPLFNCDQMAKKIYFAKIPYN